MARRPVHSLGRRRSLASHGCAGPAAPTASLLRVGMASIGPDAETTELPANDGQPRRRTSELGEDRQQKQQSGHGQHEARHRPDDHAVQAQQGRRDEPSVQIALAVAAVKDSEGIDTSLARWRARPSGTSRRHASGRCRRGCRKRAAGW